MKTGTIILETERLWIRPLSYQQLISYLKKDGTLEKELEVQPMKRIITPELVVAFEKGILPSVGNPRKNYLFSTLWTLIDKEDNVMVGDLCFKGEPNEEGEVEIGYGTYAQFQNKGYMTEALGAMINWAFSHEHVNAILAETHISNLSSQKIIMKNGFVKFREGEKMIWWKKTRAITVDALA
jgi:GNAT superfamily N-acetyltransferase